MRHLLTLPALFLAGFLWQLGRDAARSLVIRRSQQREVPQMRRAAPPAATLSRPERGEVLFVANNQGARWVVQ